ncbi:hypothetical protein HYPSUDRAFT_707598 [Hypholoma sublateritium FD-334 SS-4]|uniref:Uncharacterized protein n=1 Tax=Hypholoma sublateritium (strain FD-334 SS-4) TaxID=945553 RepID=A0A0D2Q9Z9_HYPSF|nr:hypothetical protein HYPSUDRAFT_707598 [Hypholoma sublateritium FD-334 SS-4]
MYTAQHRAGLDANQARRPNSRDSRLISTAAPASTLPCIDSRTPACLPRRPQRTCHTIAQLIPGQPPAGGMEARVSGGLGLRTCEGRLDRLSGPSQRAAFSGCARCATRLVTAPGPTAEHRTERHRARARILRRVRRTVVLSNAHHPSSFAQPSLIEITDSAQLSTRNIYPTLIPPGFHRAELISISAPNCRLCIFTKRVSALPCRSLHSERRCEGAYKLDEHRTLEGHVLYRPFICLGAKVT